VDRLEDATVPHQSPLLENGYFRARIIGYNGMDLPCKSRTRQITHTQKACATFKGFFYRYFYTRILGGFCFIVK
jgi:hypothetical protein